MSWLNGSDAPWTMLLGFLMMASAWLLWRSHRWGSTSSRRDPLDEARASISARERAETARLHEMEVRLHDIQRQVEGTIATRIQLLDQLVADADLRIAQLLDAIAHARGFGEFSSPAEEVDVPVFPLESTDTRPERAVSDMIRLLSAAGFDVPEIARLVRLPEAVVEEELGPDGLADAA